jgi:polysaccharide biosynthesis protein PslH
MTNGTNDKPLRILVISTQLPYPPNNGGASRMFHIYRRLGQRHTITWACPLWDDAAQYLGDVKQFCAHFVELPQSEAISFPDRGWRRLLFKVVSRLHWERLFVFCYGYPQAPGMYWLPASPERIKTLRDLAASSNFDVIISEFEGNAELAAQLGLDMRVPKVITLHNAQSQLFQRGRQSQPMTFEDKLFFWPELWQVQRYEKQFYPKQDLAVVMSQEDYAMIQRRCPELPLELIANGADLEYFCPTPNESDNRAGKSLIYFGHFGYPPNAAAMVYFCREIFPHIRRRVPDAQIFVIGKSPPDEIRNCDGVQVLGFVPDIRLYAAQADVMVAPLLSGGGTRLKILEAMGMGKPVVSTTIGAEGIHYTHGQDILIADDPQVFADEVVKLLEDPAMRSRIGKAGRSLVEREYDWAVLTDQFEAALRRIVNTSSPIGS